MTHNFNGGYGQDIVHLKDNLDLYSITENGGIVTFISDDNSYTIQNVEKIQFKYNNIAGKNTFILSDFVNQWTKIIEPSSTLSSMDSFGDISQISSTFYSDTKGIGWGTNDDSRKVYIIDPTIVFTEMYIEYSGGFNTPNNSLGYLSVSKYNGNGIAWNNQATHNTSLLLADGMSTASSGQTLNVNGVSIFSSAQIDVDGRIDTLNTTDNIIAMSGYTSGFPYGKRYIKNLWVR